jgi:hypothetical protein
MYVPPTCCVIVCNRELGEPISILGVHNKIFDEHQELDFTKRFQFSTNQPSPMSILIWQGSGIFEWCKGMHNWSWHSRKTFQGPPIIFWKTLHENPRRVRSLLLQPHFEGSVRLPLTLPKMGLGSPPGLPKTQSAIARVKTPCIEALFIPMERSWNVHVQNGFDEPFGHL